MFFSAGYNWPFPFGPQVKKRQTFRISPLLLGLLLSRVSAEPGKKTGIFGCKGHCQVDKNPSNSHRFIQGGPRNPPKNSLVASSGVKKTTTKFPPKKISAVYRGQTFSLHFLRSVGGPSCDVCLAVKVIDSTSIQVSCCMYHLLTGRTKYLLTLW